MSSGNATSRTRIGEKKGATTRTYKTESLTQKAPHSKARTSSFEADATNQSPADKKMLRAWTTISKNRSTTKRKK